MIKKTPGRYTATRRRHWAASPRVVISFATFRRHSRKSVRLLVNVTWKIASPYAILIHFVSFIIRGDSEFRGYFIRLSAGHARRRQKTPPKYLPAFCFNASHRLPVAYLLLIRSGKRFHKTLYFSPTSTIYSKSVKIWNERNIIGYWG